MSDKLPALGTPEGLQTEFKRAEKLRNPTRRRDIVRTVVAMTNARGGTIWVGLTEDEGALTGLDPVPLGPADRKHLDSLRNQLIDLVEPMIELDRDVTLETIEVHGGWVLRIRVRQGGGTTPHCFLSGKAREFLTRSGSRNAPLPYSRIVKGPSHESSIREATETKHQTWGRRFPRSPGLSLTIVPDPCPHPESSRVPEGAVELLASPPDGLVREGGWTWFSKYGRASRYRGWARAGSKYEEGPYRWLELSPGGELEFFTGTYSLVWKEHWETPRIELDLPPRGQLYPYALIETVASLTRLYSSLLEFPEYAHVKTVGLLLSLERAVGWTMCRKGPNEWRHMLGARSEWFQVLENPTSTPVLVRTATTIRESPDSVSYELLVDLLETDGGTQSTLPWFEGTPDTPRFVPPH